MRIRRVVVVPYSAAAMFALVDDIQSYPDFLPWCAAANITRDGEQVQATLRIQYCGLHTSFTTHNCHTPPHRIRMALAAGPLQSLTGGWQFADLDAGRCRITFMLEYRFVRGALGTVFERVFDSVFARFVECFVHRAQSCYGANDAETICVTVAHAIDGEKTLTLSKNATVGDALVAGGYAAAESAGVFGRICVRQTPLSAGDRVEVYLPLKQEPRRRRRLRADS